MIQMSKNASPEPDAKFMSPKQAAAVFGVSLSTMMRWIKDSRIETVQPAGPRGRILIPR